MPEPPQRIQLKRRKGWRLPANAINVARPARWGNPYRLDVFERDKALALFENTVQGFWDPAVVADLPDALGVQAHKLHCASRAEADDVSQLRGHSVACWCALDQRCHVDILLRLANA